MYRSRMFQIPATTTKPDEISLSVVVTKSYVFYSNVHRRAAVPGADFPTSIRNHLYVLQLFCIKALLGMFLMHVIQFFLQPKIIPVLGV